MAKYRVGHMVRCIKGAGSGLRYQLYHDEPLLVTGVS